MDAHPRLGRAIRDVARETKVPEEVLRRHVGEAVLEALDRYGAVYAREVGDAIRRAERLRNEVHAFYDRILSGQDTNPDPAVLTRSFLELQKAIHEMSDPQAWAKKQVEAGGGQARVLPEAPPEPPTVAGAGGARGTGSHPMTDSVSTRRRRTALARSEQEALAAAQARHPELLEAALRGDPGSTAALAEGMKGSGMPPEQVAAALAGLAAVREPGLSYALGGRAGGSRLTDIGGRGGAAHQAFGHLSAKEQAAVRRAASADPDFVRGSVMSEITHGDPRGAKRPWRPEEMDQFCQKHGFSGQERANLEAALAGLHGSTLPELRARQDPPSAIPRSKWSRSAQRRALRDIDPVVGLGLPPTGEIANALRGSSTLRRLASENPEHFMNLADAWLARAAERRAQGQRVGSLREYVLGIMRTQLRGMAGEFSAAFRLGDDFWVMKAPDIRVTEPGTDFVVISKRTGETWFCDNKTLSDSSLGRVSSLVDNIGQNMADDVAQFGREIESARLPVPPEVTMSLARAKVAALEIGELVARTPTEQIRSPEVQAQITAICNRHGVRRVVTNAGGELSQLTQALTNLGVDLANLEGFENQYPTRALGNPPVGDIE
jgi:hypothetical protein